VVRDRRMQAQTAAERRRVPPRAETGRRAAVGPPEWEGRVEAVVVGVPGPVAVQAVLAAASVAG